MKKRGGQRRPSVVKLFDLSVVGCRVPRGFCPMLAFPSEATVSASSLQQSQCPAQCLAHYRAPSLPSLAPWTAALAQSLGLQAQRGLSLV